MKIDSVLKPKHMVWASGAVLAVLLLIVRTRSGAEASVQASPPPIVEVATVEQRDVPVYGEWIGTLTGQVNADVKAQVTGYLLTRKYKEGSYVRKGELLFEIDPRPFQAALDQAQALLAQAKAQLVQDQAQRATAQANKQMSQLNVDKYAPLAAVDAVSKPVRGARQYFRGGSLHRDAIAMLRPACERLQNQQVERSLQYVRVAFCS